MKSNHPTSNLAQAMFTKDDAKHNQSDGSTFQVDLDLSQLSYEERGNFVSKEDRSVSHTIQRTMHVSEIALTFTMGKDLSKNFYENVHRLEVEHKRFKLNLVLEKSNEETMNYDFLMMKVFSRIYQRREIDVINERYVLSKLSNHEQFFPRFIGSWQKIKNQSKIDVILTERWDFRIQDVLSIWAKYPETNTCFTEDEKLNIITHFLKMLEVLKSFSIAHNKINPQNLVYSIEKRTFILVEFTKCTIESENHIDQRTDIKNLGVALEKFLSPVEYNPEGTPLSSSLLRKMKNGEPLENLLSLSKTDSSELMKTSTPLLPLYIQKLVLVRKILLVLDTYIQKVSSTKESFFSEEFPNLFERIRKRELNWIFQKEFLKRLFVNTKEIKNINKFMEIFKLFEKFRPREYQNYSEKKIFKDLELFHKLLLFTQKKVQPEPLANFYRNNRHVAITPNKLTFCSFEVNLLLPMVSSSLDGIKEVLIKEDVEDKKHFLTGYGLENENTYKSESEKFNKIFYKAANAHRNTLKTKLPLEQSKAEKELIPENCHMIGITKFHRENYIYLERLGKGVATAVWRAFDKAHDIDVAIKSYDLTFKQNKNFNETKILLDMFLKEYEIYEIFAENQTDSRVEYLPKFFGAFYETNKANKIIALTLVSEVGDASLDALLKARAQHCGYTPSESLFVVKHILNALSFLADNCIYHSDVKLKNIVWVRAKNKYILLDFGGSKVLEANIEQITLSSDDYSIYTDDFVSPEKKLLIDKNDLVSSFNPFRDDIWALGKCLDRLCNRDELAKNVTAQNLYGMLLESNPEMRGSAKQCLNLLKDMNEIPNEDKYYKKIIWDFLLRQDVEKLIGSFLHAHKYTKALELVEHQYERESKNEEQFSIFNNLSYYYDKGRCLSLLGDTANALEFFSNLRTEIEKIIGNTDCLIRDIMNMKLASILTIDERSYQNDFIHTLMIKEPDDKQLKEIYIMLKRALNRTGQYNEEILEDPNEVKSAGSLYNDKDLSEIKLELAIESHVKAKEFSAAAKLIKSRLDSKFRDSIEQSMYEVKLAEVESLQKQHEKALSLYQNAASKISKLTGEENIMIMLRLKMRISQTLFQLGRVEEALGLTEIIIERLRNSKTINNDAFLAVALYESANALYHKTNFELSEKHYKLALNLFKGVTIAERDQCIIFALYRKAALHSMFNEQAKAKKYFLLMNKKLKSEQTPADPHMNFLKILSLINKGKNIFMAGEHPKAFRNFCKVLKKQSEFVTDNHLQNKYKVALQNFEAISVNDYMSIINSAHRMIKEYIFEEQINILFYMLNMGEALESIENLPPTVEPSEKTAAQFKNSFDPFETSNRGRNPRGRQIRREDNSKQLRSSAAAGKNANSDD